MGINKGNDQQGHEFAVLDLSDLAIEAASKPIELTTAMARSCSGGGCGCSGKSGLCVGWLCGK